LIHQRVTRSIAFVLLGKNKPGGIAQGLLFSRDRSGVGEGFEKKLFAHAGDP
jgi:hypothetical protein